jgi:hypothetical protein
MKNLEAKKFILHAQASKKFIPLPIPQGSEWEMTLLEYLRKQKIPIASSCNGMGVCRKCLVGPSLLSCQITLQQLFSSNLDSPTVIIAVTYL